MALAAGLFAAVNLMGGGQSGAASADEATHNFFEALSDQDLIGMLEMLDPAERDVMLDFVRRLDSELTRLAITEETDLRDVPGIDLEVQGLEVTTTELGSGVTEVALTDGAITWETVPDSVPIGDVLRDLIEADGDEVEIERTADEMRIDEAEDDVFLIATESGGRWHLNISFTIAEYGRRDAELPLPDFDGGVDPQGADSPEDAVSELVDAAADLDTERVISLLPPDEMRALQVYAPLFLDDAREGAQELREDEGFEMSVEGLELDTSSVPGGTRVVPTAAKITYSTYEDGTSTIDWNDGCVEVSGELAEDMEDDDFSDTTFCLGDTVDEIGSELSEESEQELRELMAIFEEYEMGVVTVERDGAHYVDPLRTYTDASLQTLEVVERSDLEEGGILYRLFTGELTLWDELFNWDDDDWYDDDYDDPFYDDYDDDWDEPSYDDDSDLDDSDDVDYDDDWYEDCLIPPEEETESWDDQDWDDWFETCEPEPSLAP